MRKTKRKLTLSGETLRMLTDAEKARAVGAYASGRSCDFGNCNTERDCGITWGTCAPCGSNSVGSCDGSCVGC